VWEFIKLLWALCFTIVAAFASLIACIGLGLQAIQRLFEKKEEQRKLELDAREEALNQLEARRNLLGPNPDTDVLEAHATELLLKAGFPAWETFLDGIKERYEATCQTGGGLAAAYEARWPLITALVELYIQEGLFEPPARQLVAGVIDAGRYRDALVAYVHKVQDPGKLLEVLSRKLIESAMAFTSRLPPFARQPLAAEHVEAADTNSIALIDALPNVGSIVDEMTMPLLDVEARVLNLFPVFRKQFEENKANEKRKPSEDKRSPREIVAAYLKDTKLKQVFECNVPFEIPISRRLEHTAIVAGSGWGKTQLLQSMIAADLQKPNPPAVVVIDSTGAMVRRVQRLAIFNQQLKDRLVIIDPELDPVPALNMFDISNPRFQAYDAALRESIESEIVGLFNYVFSSTDNPLTAQQATPFAFMVRLLLSMPGASINTLIELLEDNPKAGYEDAAPKFKQAIERLDTTAQTFFKTQYYSRGTSEARRDQIAQRVYGVIKVPAFQRMFSTINKVDMFAELNKGSIILVNTSENLLKEASATFGRYMVARTMAAAFERATIPESDRSPAFLIVDEAAPYFDDTFEKLLTRVRQFKLGVVIAFQHLEQASQKLRSAIASSTTVKYAGGVGYSDRSWLAREMETAHEFIGAQKKDSREPPHWSQFACYVRNFTDQAVSLTVPFFQLENLPKMTDAEHAALAERNRARVSADRTPEVAAAEFPSADIPASEQNGRPSQPVAAAPDTPRPVATAADSGSQTEGATEEWR